jgi:hypothetical protein
MFEYSKFYPHILGRFIILNSSITFVKIMKGGFSHVAMLTIVRIFIRFISFIAPALTTFEVGRF